MYDTVAPFHKIGTIFTIGLPSESFEMIKNIRSCTNKTYSQVIYDLINENADLIDSISTDELNDHLIVTQTTKRVVHTVNIKLFSERMMCLVNYITENINSRDVFPLRKKERIRSTFIRLILEKIYEREMSNEER